MTCTLCEGTDEADPTEGEVDARGNEAAGWSPPHADAVCDQSSHADKRGGRGLSGVSPNRDGHECRYRVLRQREASVVEELIRPPYYRGQGLCSSAVGGNIATRTHYSLQAAPRSSGALGIRRQMARGNAVRWLETRPAMMKGRGHLVFCS